MDYAIELFFDRAFEKRISAFFRKMKRAGISSAMLDTRSRPHVALQVIQTDEPLAVLRALKALASRVKPFPLDFGRSHIGVFSNTGAVFLAPTVTMELLKVHRACERALRRYTKDCWDYYKVDQLFFHCTLGLRLTPRQVLRAVKLAVESRLPQGARVVEIGLVAIPDERIPRVKHLFTVKLGTKPRR